MASTVMSLSAAGALLAALTAAVAAAGDWGFLTFSAALGLAGVIAVLVLIFLPERLPNNRFGPANFLTLARAFLTCLLAAALGAELGDPAIAWTLCAVAAFALLLDGLDGWVARRRRETSAFGARFDMETDALFVLVLALLVYGLGKAGPWILLAGALRYGFVAARLVWPWLSGELPASRRRKLVFVAQTGALVLCLAPLVPAAVAAPLAGAGLTALTGSFAWDVAWLARHRPKGGIPS